MAPKKSAPQIPPARPGRRPLSPASARIANLEVGGRVAFERAYAASARALAAWWGKKLGRRYVTRIEDDGGIAVWRAE